MNRLLRSIVLFVIAAMSWFDRSLLRADPPSFAGDVRPILSQYCFKCHGPDNEARRGGVRLDRPEAAIAAGESGVRPVVPGNVAASELVRRIRSADPDEVMPPRSTKMVLTEAQKEILEQWIADGANYSALWAFVPPRDFPVPVADDPSWNERSIDRFALAKLKEKGLSSNPPADPYEVIRRVYFDLIGLPPSVAAADAFAADPSDAAYEKLVDDLLSHPGYGERWARKWLDLARYADTNGYEKDKPRTIWPYRDWVIDALQDDMPFDQFTIEQLAGDMLPGASLSQRIATGFHRNTMLNEEGGIDPLEFRFHAMTDRVATTGTVWLGLTLMCAQCHTHKYDPIAQTEYYGLMALLDNADEPELPIPDPTVESKRAEIEASIARLTRALPDRFPVAVDVDWTVANGEVRTESGVAVVQKDDGAFFVEGPPAETDRYVATLPAKSGEWISLRLQALADARLPSKGPGLTPHGNFVVTELSAKVVAEGLAEREIKIAEATVDFAQDQFPAAHMLDGKPNTGWAIHGPGEWNVNRTATFRFAEPLKLSDGERLVVAIDQSYGGKHLLGKFSLSLGKSVAADVPVAQRRQEAIDVAFAQWIAAEVPKAGQWRVARVAAARSNLPLLTIQDDQSVLATGDFTKSDMYEISLADVPAGVTAIRLEAIPDERLPRGGPGAVYYEGPHGDFYLSEVEVDAAGQAARIVEGTQSFASGGHVAAKCFDGDQQSGWSIDGGQGRRHVAVFKFAEPTRAAGTMNIKMLCERYYAPGMGRFRWSTTTESKVGPATDMPEQVAAVLRKPIGQWSADERAVVFERFLQTTPELKVARQEIDSLKASLAVRTTTLSMRERPADNPRPTFRRHRGEYLLPREQIAPATPAFLTTAENPAPRNRLEFARWLVSPSNPLTARVTVNRAWESFFGRGLVRTSQDFGYQGELPTHPELLDHLALQFVRNGWSLKQLHKSIVMSRVYRQSAVVRKEAAERDSDNRWLSRGPRTRLEAEQLRDGALAIAGLLSSKRGGPSVFPPQPSTITTEGAYGQFAWNVSAGEDRWRRSLYTFTKRTTPFAFFATFDAPSGEACVARRDSTNTPLQALSLLNDVSMIEAARALGRWATEQSPDDSVRATAILRRTITRPPTSREVEAVVAYARRQRERMTASELPAARIVGDTAASEAATEQAVWTLVARVALNLDDTVVK